MMTRVGYSFLGLTRDRLEHRRRKPLVKHQVDDDSRDRHIKPDWQRPTGDAFVFIEATPDRGDHGEDDHGQVHYCQEYMRDENGEVNWADGAFLSESDRGGARMALEHDVVGQVAAQKGDRN